MGAVRARAAGVLRRRRHLLHLTHELLDDARFPAPADGLYLSHYPLFVAGLVLLLRRRSPGRDRDGLLDALIVTTGIGLLAWVFVLGPYVRTAGLSLPARVVSLAYPLMDLLVGAVAARLAVGGGARPPAWWLLLASLVGLLAADGQYALAQLHGTYQTGAALDAGWLLSYVGLGAAAQAERARLLHRLGAIIDASPVAIVELDPAGCNCGTRPPSASTAGAARRSSADPTRPAWSRAGRPSSPPPPATGASRPPTWNCAITAVMAPRSTWSWRPRRYRPPAASRRG